MSTRTQPLSHRMPSARRVVGLVAAVLVLAGAAVVVDRVALRPGGHAPASPFAVRPDLEATIGGLVVGSARASPGATAYVAGPHGAWLGSVGVANVRTGAPIRADARLRLESISKFFTATVVMQLVQQGKLKLSDTVARWLPGLLPYGDRITLRELMTDTTGLIDDNDVLRSAAAARGYLARVKNPGLRAGLIASIRRMAADSAAEVSPLSMIRLAAWQPLRFTPGSRYHHSNIGWNIVGLIAQRAAGKPLAVLYQHGIFGPLGLRHTAYDPQGPIAGPHVHGYWITGNGMPTGTTVTDTTNSHPFKGADGGIVSDAQDTATFFTALMHGKLINRRQLTTMKRDNLVNFRPQPTGCGGFAHFGNGAGNGYMANVEVNDNGSHIAVLLLNANNPRYGTQTALDTAAALYCEA
jgi:D-alanyl-D-alanine carboxypeptidase